MRRFQSHILILAIVLLCAAAATNVRIREHVLFFAAPSAERAYGYGIGHIMSTSTSYSLADAKYFFTQTARLEPEYPYVHHQLARIAFLNADYPSALAEVNLEIENDMASDRASAYYMRGLIEGYMNQYDAAVRDYKKFVELEPGRWEGRTDYAWVLIKTGRFDEALSVIDAGLKTSPGNPWLLSVRATVLYEQGKIAQALPVAREAAAAVDGITEAMWLKAYPGNSPDAAHIGITTLRTAAHTNLEKIETAANAQGIK